MIIREIPAIKKYLANSPFATHPLFKRKLQTLTSLEIGAFVRASKFDDLESEALALVDILTKHAYRSLTNGKISAAPFVERSVKKQGVFTSQELVVMLAKTSLVRRQAILFCLEADMHPRHAIGLTWKQAREMHFTDLANEILDAQPRHIRLPYVFWEQMEGGSVSPLFALCETAEDISGDQWASFKLMYADMIWVDSTADREAVIEDIIDTYAKTL